MLSPELSHNLRGLTALLTAGASSFLLNALFIRFANHTAINLYLATFVPLGFQAAFMTEAFMQFASSHNKNPIPAYPRPFLRGIAAGLIWGALNSIFLIIFFLSAEIRTISQALDAIPLPSWLVGIAILFIAAAAPPYLGFWAARPRMPYHDKPENSQNS